jgi:hypothetical protein
LADVEHGFEGVAAWLEVGGERGFEVGLVVGVGTFSRRVELLVGDELGDERVCSAFAGGEDGRRAGEVIGDDLRE